MRRRLARDTAAEHAALHVHPQLLRLRAPDLTPGEYGRLLQAYLSVFAAIEDRRRALCVYETLSLDRAVAALRADLRRSGAHPPAPLDPSCAPDATRAVLAALYVLHGARFGARVICADLVRSVPGAPHHFFTSVPDSRLWRDLGGELDRHGQDETGYSEIVNSARATFQAFGYVMSDVCGRGAYRPAVTSVSGATREEVGDDR